jgi:hypothetical protein
MGWGAYSSRGGVIASVVVLQLFSSICIGLRFYTRFWRRQSILVSDWLVLAAFVCATGLSVMEIYGSYAMLIRCQSLVLCDDVMAQSAGLMLDTCRSSRARVCDTVEFHESRVAREE